MLVLRVLDGLQEGGVDIRGHLRSGVLRDVDDLGPGVGRELDRLDHRVDVAAALVVVLTDRDDRRFRGEADETGAVELPGRDDPRDLGAVAHRGVGLAGAALVQEVRAVGDCALELRVDGVDTGVDDGDLDVLALGVLPQLVQDDTLQRPGRSLDDVGRERAAGVVDLEAHVVVGQGGPHALCGGSRCGPRQGQPTGQYRHGGGACGAPTRGARCPGSHCFTSSRFVSVRDA